MAGKIELFTLWVYRPADGWWGCPYNEETGKADSRQGLREGERGSVIVSVLMHGVGLIELHTGV